MKILGVGLSKTGTTSLAHAVRLLGFSSIHYDQQRLTPLLLGRDPSPDFRVYDDVDAVFDIPSAYFYRELLAAYPESRAILSVRDLEGWWRSIERHFNQERRVTAPGGRDYLRALVRGPARLRAQEAEIAFRTNLRNCVYGSTDAREFVFKKKFIEHNERVRQEVDPARLLVIDVTAGQGWPELCSFLDIPIPNVPFPHSNITERRA
jgi:hypothetical protein